MKLFLSIIIGVFIVTFAWGLLVNVWDGPMKFGDYTKHYTHETKENFLFVGEWVQRKLKPPTRKEFDPNAY